MKHMLCVIRILFGFPIFAFEIVLKVISAILIFIIALILTLFYPLFGKQVVNKFKNSLFFKYGTVYEQNFPITDTVCEMWSYY